jgi:PAS domain S-box-containing protein
MLLHRDDGCELHLAVTTALVTDHDAVARIAVAVVHDISDLRHAQLSAATEKERALVTLAAITDGVITVDRRGNIISTNPAAEALMGLSQEQARARPVGQAISFDSDCGASAAALADAVSACMAERRVITGLPHLSLRSPDGAVHAVEYALAPVPHGGGDAIGAVLVLHDVTELRKLEAIRRDFVANVSHELRTPLTSICGYAETLLTDRPDDATTRRFLETILSNGRRMQRLVDDLLDLSRIESGRWQPVPVALDPAAAAREVWASLGDRTGARPVEFAIDAAPDAPELRADPDALRQILTNLLDNSLRHTPPGGTITCRIRREDGGIALSVRDTGTGIAREHLPRIFERFYRADASRSRDAGGTGLGLAIVKHLVEGHGGRVSAESERGAGTAVTCWFPA